MLRSSTSVPVNPKGAVCVPVPPQLNRKEEGTWLSGLVFYMSPVSEHCEGSALPVAVCVTGIVCALCVCMLVCICVNLGSHVAVWCRLNLAAIKEQPCSSACADALASGWAPLAASGWPLLEVAAAGGGHCSQHPLTKLFCCRKNDMLGKPCFEGCF